MARYTFSGKVDYSHSRKDSFEFGDLSKGVTIILRGDALENIGRNFKVNVPGVKFDKKITLIVKD